MNAQMRWKLSLNEKNMYVADLFIKDIRATATHRKRKKVRIMAAKNMLRIIENDPTLKQKFLAHMYKMEIGLPLKKREHTNLKVFDKLKKRICRDIDTLDKQKHSAATKKFKEPTDLLDHFENLDGKLAVGNVELLD